MFVLTKKQLSALDQRETRHVAITRDSHQKRPQDSYWYSAIFMFQMWGGTDVSLSVVSSQKYVYLSSHSYMAQFRYYWERIIWFEWSFILLPYPQSHNSRNVRFQVRTTPCASRGSCLTDNARPVYCKAFESSAFFPASLPFPYLCFWPADRVRWTVVVISRIKSGLISSCLSGDTLSVYFSGVNFLYSSFLKIS